MLSLTTVKCPYVLEPTEEVPTVVFTAAAVSNRAYDGSQPVIFDDIITDVGNAYDVNSSIFTCPVSGVYMFSMSFMSTPDNYSEVFLMHQGSAVIRLYADDVVSSYTSASNLAFVQCSQGQSLWVMTSSGRDAHDVHVYTTFSGMLLSL